MKKKFSDNILLRMVETDEDVFIYYDDGTFAGENWHPSKRSYWEIRDDKFYFRHEFNTKWICMNDDLHERLVYRLLNEIATREIDKYLR